MELAHLCSHDILQNKTSTVAEGRQAQIWYKITPEERPRRWSKFWGVIPAFLRKSATQAPFGSTVSTSGFWPAVFLSKNLYIKGLQAARVSSRSPRHDLSRVIYFNLQLRTRYLISATESPKSCSLPAWRLSQSPRNLPSTVQFLTLWQERSPFAQQCLHGPG